jgi:hypothetical protein
MRGWFALALVAALVAWDVWRGDLPGPPGGGAAVSAEDPDLVGGADEATADRPRRDPFRYGAERAAAGLPVLRDSPDLAQVAVTTPEPAPHVRLVGFIRQGGDLRAALSVLGRVSLLGEGEGVDGYELVALEEGVGVRIRFPDGVEQELRLPPR